MRNKKIFLLDFDGVIIDGINEYWKRSLLACKSFLNSKDIPSDLDINIHLPNIFIELRPWVKYGWEMVLITHEIIRKNNSLNNYNQLHFVKNYSHSCKKILEENSLNPITLQKSLDNAREYQISNNFVEWINLHRAHKEVIFFIKKAQKYGLSIGIITTKKKIFTKKILEKFNVNPELIFGYESGSKIQILNDLMNDYEILGFIEDRRKTLLEIVENDQTKDLTCYLADWGYLKNTDRIGLPSKIKLIKLKDLENLLANSI